MLWSGDDRTQIPSAPEPESPAGPRMSSPWRGLWKFLLISVTVLVVLVLGAAGAIYGLANYYVSSVHRIGNPFVSIPAPDRPPRPTGPARPAVERIRLSTALESAGAITVVLASVRAIAMSSTA